MNPDNLIELENNCERAAYSSSGNIGWRETLRYLWANDNIKGKKILELGCSTGFGTRFLPKDIDYTGVDYSQQVIDYAKKEFPMHKFYCWDLEKFDEFTIKEHYDTIIMFECLEHLSNGKEIVQQLKKHCDCLLLSTPYNEPRGMWGPHHKLHNLLPIDFPGFKIEYMLDTCVVNWPDSAHEFSLMLMKWAKNQVTVAISTKDRYYTTLPACLLSIANQTVKPDKLILFDDGEQKDLREDPIYKPIFDILNQKRINWKVLFGKKMGQVANHQSAIELADTELIWRVDDDNFVEPNVLEGLLKLIEPEDVGAVASLSLFPALREDFNQVYSAFIGDVKIKPHLQWSRFNGVQEVDALTNTFLFRKSTGMNYCGELSPVGHREETLFTYGIKKKGYKVLVTGDLITWHMRQPYGGIRSWNDSTMYDYDEKVFDETLEFYENRFLDKKIVVLEGGIGDHIMFKKILPEIKEKYKDVVLAVCYPEIFPNEQIISIKQARQIYGDLRKYNVYEWMWRNNWTGEVIDAYRKVYL